MEGKAALQLKIGSTTFHMTCMWIANIQDEYLVRLDILESLVDLREREFYKLAMRRLLCRILPNLQYRHATVLYWRLQ